MRERNELNEWVVWATVVAFTTPFLIWMAKNFEPWLTKIFQNAW